MSLLDVRNLSVVFPTMNGNVQAVNNVSFEVTDGETLGIIGESGSGKSVISLAILKLLPNNALISGTVMFGNKDLLKLNGEQMRKVRGRHISLMPQNPSGSLNPFLKNGIQIAEVYEQQGIRLKDGLAMSIDIMKRLFFKDPEKISRQYPHQLSGGMKQMLLASISLSFGSRLLIADEPTKGLDPESKKRSIELFTHIKKEHNISMLLITHDLDIALEVCDRIAVMYSGEIVEIDKAPIIINSPSHPYTRGLVKALPRNGLIPLNGQSPSKIELSEDCWFNDRCNVCFDICLKSHPQMAQHNGGFVRCHLF